MRYLSLQEVLSLHSLMIAQSGGSSGLRDRGALESAVAQPEASFGGHELYPDLASKVGALGHSLIQNHPFVDGNKRVGHVAMEVDFFCSTDTKLSHQLMSRRRTIIDSRSDKTGVCHNPATN